LPTATIAPKPAGDRIAEEFPPVRTANRGVSNTFLGGLAIDVLTGISFACCTVAEAVGRLKSSAGGASAVSVRVAARSQFGI
jgi:uncharacterized membrane protein